MALLPLAFPGGVLTLLSPCILPGVPSPSRVRGETSGARPRRCSAGSLVLVDFWTLECYNCLIALPHVKALYATYRDRRFVVVGVHTPELARERVPGSVRREVRRLRIVARLPAARDATTPRGDH